MKTKAPSGEKKYPSLPDAEGGRPWLLTLPFTSIILIHAIGSFCPQVQCWGFNYWTLFPRAFALGILAMALMLTLSGPAALVARGLTPIVTPVFKRLAGLNRYLLAVVGVIIAFILLYLMRSRAYVYGDGFSILSNISDPNKVILHDQLYIQVLSVYFLHHMFVFLKSIFDLPPGDIDAITSTIGGVIGVFGIYRLAVALGSETTSRTFIFIGALTSAAVILFFGYVENYTSSLAVGLVSLGFSIGYLKGQNRLWWPLLTALLACALHAIALPFLAAVVMAVMLRRSDSEKLIFRLSFSQFCVITVIASFVFVLTYQLVQLPMIFSPLWPRVDNRYLVFSVEHFVDVFNELILVAPLGLAVILLVLLARKRTVSSDPVARLLFFTALAGFLMSFWIDPKLGAPRDWDLLAFYGIPLTLWAVYGLTLLMPGGRVSSQWLVPVVVVLLIHIGPNLYEKNHPDIAVNRLDVQLWKDPHYRGDYERAYRCVSWGYILRTGASQEPLSVKYFRRRLATFDGCYQSWFNLGEIYYNQKKYDSAAVSYRRAASLEPDAARPVIRLARTAEKLGRLPEALQFARRAVQLEPENFKTSTQLGLILGAMGRDAEALPYFRKAFNLSPNTYAELLNLGIAHGALGKADSAFFYHSRALPMAPATERPDILSELIELSMQLGKKQDAQNFLQQLQRMAPSYPDLPRLNEMVTGRKSG